MTTWSDYTDLSCPELDKANHELSVCCLSMNFYFFELRPQIKMKWAKVCHITAERVGSYDNNDRQGGGLKDMNNIAKSKQEAH